MDAQARTLRARRESFAAALAVAIASALGAGGCNRAVPQPVPEAIPAAPITPEGAVFPLRKQAGQRCLVDQTGRPFLMHGDAAWTLLVQLTREDADRYLQDRRQRGFNTLLINLLEHQFAANAPRNTYGEAPFVVAGDYARPNEKYFAHVDWVLSRAMAHGFLVLLTPSFLGYNGGNQGWYREMKGAGVEKLRAYGRYLGLRYRNLTNIIWIDGGDYNPPERRLLEAIVDGLRETDPNALHSFQAARGTAARAFLGDGTAWLDVNTIYTDEHSVATAAHAEYSASLLPFFLIEARYEGDGASEAVVRAQGYQAILQGACGYVMGNMPIWSFESGWERALDSPGARGMTQMRSLLEALDWAQLRPAPDGFIAAGVGTGVTRAAAALSEDGRRAVVYVPSAREIAINTGQLRGPKIRSRWIDPVNASYIPATPSKSGKSLDLRLRPPEKNSSGYGDWILVLDSRP